jgi:FKBP-type peptidyl-prolyl cis-trans isomerase
MTMKVNMQTDVSQKEETMIRKWHWLGLLGVVLLTANCTQEPTDLKTDKDKVNYGIGVSVGRNFKQQNMEIDVDLVVKGMKDELGGKKLLLNEDELRKTMVAYQSELRRKQKQERLKASLENRKEGVNFWGENKAKEGVVTLPNGLQYKILKEGTGPKPTVEDTVEVRYRGTFVNGQEFDSSGSEARTFKLNQVILGWQEALPLMPVGSKWQLVVPSQLAYGEQGSGQAIMPNATLIFEVELVSINPPEVKPPENAQPPEGKTEK